MTYIATADVPAGSSGASLAAIVALVRDAYSIKSVAHGTERAQAVADWPTRTGAAISAANPVMVYRQDTDAIEISEDGTTFTTFKGGDTGWTAATEPTGWTTNTSVSSRVVGGSVCSVRGIARPNSGDIAAASTGVTVCTLVSGHRPSTTIYSSAVTWVSGSASPYLGDAAIIINTAGVVQVYVPRTATGVLINTAFMVG